MAQLETIKHSQQVASVRETCLQLKWMEQTSA